MHKFTDSGTDITRFTAAELQKLAGVFSISPTAQLYECTTQASQHATRNCASPHGFSSLPASFTARLSDPPLRESSTGLSASAAPEWLIPRPSLGMLTADSAPFPARIRIALTMHGQYALSWSDACASRSIALTLAC